ncbi:DUF1638 domain-containing protein [Alkalibacter rhizosphaerae]|uniref:DUF1638 domain-containing protein n=1 Tax=Alkalibacter rhizosphaerae TaxID=2815577 RepID=A0A974XEY9_9FIRM|nr:DUF1638 domain-containing protein [Alkalibacter rhizosphaerae]QSX08624.1 DUF1638 domain-containing protein [Alkalibacter rhizosphaerae]
MKTLILSCNTIRAELDLTIQQWNIPYPVIYLESGLHLEPDLLRKEMQKILDRVSNVDQVLLIMGFCGNAVVGLKTNDFRLVVPKADDCLTLLLGSMDRRKEVQREKNTYFLSKGWLDMFDDVEKTMMDEYHRMTKRYGQERAEKIFRSYYRHYERLGVIDTGAFDMDDMLEQAKSTAAMMDLEIEPLKGTMNFLDAFVLGPWDDDTRFIRIEPHSTLELKHTLS